LQIANHILPVIKSLVAFSVVKQLLLKVLIRTYPTHSNDEPSQLQQPYPSLFAVHWQHATPTNNDQVVEERGQVAAVHVGRLIGMGGVRNVLALVVAIP